MIQILITDDHPVVRQGLKQVISETSDITVAGEAGTGQEALDMIRTNEYDLVLLDISLPGVSGLDILKQITAEKPKLPVLILSIHSEEQYAVRALKTGASGYMTKASAPEELIGAIRAISAGGKYITSSLSQRLVMYIQSPSDSKPPHANLSNREYEVLCLIAQGRPVSEIARTLFLSPKTVSTYRTRILDKMGMKNNAEMMRYAIKNGLVDLI